MPRKSLHMPALLLFGIYAIYSCVLAPLNEVFANDSVLFETVLWDINDFFLNLFEVLGIAAAFGFLIHGVLRYTVKKCAPLYILIGGALLFKYVSSIIALSVVWGSFDTTMDFTPYILSFSIEIALLAFVTLLAHVLISRFLETEHAQKKASAMLGQDYTPAGDTLPLRRLFSRKNPLLRSAFWGIIAMGVVRLISFAVDEITYTLFWDVPYTGRDFLDLLIYTVILVLIPMALGYLLTLGCIKLSEWYAKRTDSANEAK